MLRAFVILMTALISFSASADDLTPIGQIAYCQKEQRDAFAYLYKLEDAQMNKEHVDVSILVYNFVCSKKRENGDTVYYWKLVKDKTFTVQASANSLYTKLIKYKETETPAVYRAQISIPVKEFLSVIDEQTLREDGAVNIRRGVTFKHHSNFGWAPLGFYLLDLNLHIRKNSPSFMEVNSFARRL